MSATATVVLKKTISFNISSSSSSLYSFKISKSLEKTKNKKSNMPRRNKKGGKGKIKWITVTTIYVQQSVMPANPSYMRKQSMNIWAKNFVLSYYGLIGLNYFIQNW